MILPIINSSFNRKTYQPLIRNNSNINKANNTLSCDTVSFKGKLPPKTNEKFVKRFTTYIQNCLDNPSFLSENRQVIGETLEMIMPEINAGIRNNESGMRGFVSRLDDNFVLKIPHWFRKATPERIKEDCQMGMLHPNKFEALEDYYGHHIMTFGNIAIMKNATAPGSYVRVGRPFEIPLNEGGYEYYVHEYLPVCSTLPQKSFDKLALNLKKLNNISSGKYFYEPDTENPNNFLIFNNEFRIVDDMDPVPVPEPNNITTLVKPLVTKIATEEYAEFAEELVAPRKEIFKKCAIAAAKNQLPDVHSFSEELFLEKAYELTGMTNKAEELRSAIRENDVNKIREIFE